jgi:cation diffusion facilitator CzcD-associated flavoprotein CzcO
MTSDLKPTQSLPAHVDVLIIGAGISGIGAAVHLSKHCPAKSYLIAERRPEIGGTWDLFRYPGMRSDSDMYTLAFGFKPWTKHKAIAGADDIMAYLRETVDDYGVRQHITHGMSITAASWSSETALWTVTGTIGEANTPFLITCSMLFGCTGYYNYAQGYTPNFHGRERYKGVFINPQQWPEELDYRGKRIIVIGSGATAVTLVPSLCDGGAAKVTMLQRTPTYIASRPSSDALALLLQKFLPSKWAYAIARYKNILFQMFVYNLSRTRPSRLRKRLIAMVKDQLPEGFDVAKHFTPPYNPWDERLCAVTDGDMFRMIREGRADVVTDKIKTFTEAGILLESGEELAADIIVSATGLNLQTLSGMQLNVDGRAIKPGERLLYKGIMFNDVPNFAMWFGYTNASWTLKADLTSEYMCRLINYMDAQGIKIATPRIGDEPVGTQAMVDFSSGYIQRAKDMMPKSGTRAPWKLHQNYFKDARVLRHGPLTDEMVFETVGSNRDTRHGKHFEREVA